MVELHMLKLILIFLTIIIVLALKRPLYQSLLAGIIMTIVLYTITPSEIVKIIYKACTSWQVISLLLILYLITFLQRILEKRKQIKLAQEDLNGLFHNRRINTTVAPLFIGLLPSAAAMIICGEIVKDSTDGYLNKKEQAFVTSWFRHIPESSLPTYAAVLLMSKLAGVPLPDFMLGMLVPIVLLFLVAYIPYVRKVPKDPGTAVSTNKKKDLLNLLIHLWTLYAIILLILVFKLNVEVAVGLVVLLSLIVYRFKIKEIIPMFRESVEKNMLLNTFLVLMLKEFIEYTGLLQELPELFIKLPIPLYLVFALLFFIGTIVSGANGIIALGTPIAFATMPDAGMPLVVLLMCVVHAASQVSPTHVCLVIATEYFEVSMADLVKITLPIILIFIVLIIGYYNILILL